MSNHYQISELPNKLAKKMSLKSNDSDKILLPKRNSINGHDSSTVSNIETTSSSKSKSIKKRKRTVYAPMTKNYGPKATLKSVTDEYLLLVQDPLSQQLSWTNPPLYVLVIKKLCNDLYTPFNEVLKFLIYDHNLITFIEEKDYESDFVLNDEKLKEAMKPQGENTKSSLRKFTINECKMIEKNDRNKIDFVICIGGDGTLLHASGLFQQSCPPILSIHMGSLGFLCPFDIENYRKYINCVVKGGVPLLLRNRLKCKLEKIVDTSQKLEESTGCFTCATETSPTKSNEDCNSNELLCLNEVVVGRGCSPFLSNLDLYVNDYLITTVQGDGLIISSPTGSTAYAMAAGASMCHPSVQSIIIAPICPHSLSFRPIVVPAGCELKVALSPDSRHTAWFSVDGRNTTELKQGFYISITTSEYPLPTISRSDQLNDWFEGLATCLHWNQRQKQLPLNQCYTQNSSNLKTPSRSPSATSLKQKSEGDEADK
ncbi:unnamed protein product [Brachionus calyciflorus]|uniref:NAD(+) kinase n=1 Tax=Brachionus calyciflorus TaxID=104777 RepID=A0A813TPC2_9BILA|nr:unnamed protein product [Brachionus calyciflorus]